MEPGQSPDSQAIDVFVSYSRADEGEARRLIEFLQQAGYTVWWDGMLQAGALYTRTTEDALQQARAIVVVWSARSVDSYWVRDEAQAGREDGRLVPVTFDGSLPPLGFRQFQSVDLTRWTNGGETPELQNVCDAVGRLVGREAAAGEALAAVYRSHPVARRALAGKRLWALLAILALAAAALAAWFRGPDSGAEFANSIAILPFDNLSDDAEQAYFATGLSEEMRQVLSQSAALRVAAPTSTQQAVEKMAAGGEAVEVARALDVRYLLGGSVRRAGDTVRVAVHLIDGETGFDVWSDTYDRSLRDIFKVQSEIAGKVAQALKVKVASGGEGAGLRRGGTGNPDAYDAYLRGRALYELSRDEATDRAALRELEAAVKTDPNYGAAWAALARVQTYLANSYPSETPLGEQYANALKSARRAVAVAPDLAESQAALGFVLFNGRLDIAGAAKPYAEAYRLGQGDADVIQAYATYAARIGQFDEARAAIARAARLDPLNAVVLRSQATILHAAGDAQGARKAVLAALKINPDLRVAHRILGDLAYENGDYRGALAEYEKEDNGMNRLPGVAMARYRMGDKAGALAALDALKKEFGFNGLYQQAQILAQIDREDEALAALEAAFAANDSGLVMMRNDPMFRPLRGQPRFDNLLNRMGFSVPSA